MADSLTLLRGADWFTLVSCAALIPDSRDSGCADGADTLAHCAGVLFPGSQVCSIIICRSECSLWPFHAYRVP